ncbi:hypothetical protein Q8F55_007901 [Vanrija albida]|uniref:Uncharacterized protein n=1 Tax=Vanrija albida TaxID=181172 RepID=A0ABR3PUT5_9TREE
MRTTRSSSQRRVDEAVAAPINDWEPALELSALDIRHAPVDDGQDQELEPKWLIDEMEPVSAATRTALEPAIGLIQRLRRHLLDPHSETLMKMLIIAMDVYGQVPPAERLQPDYPTKQDLRGIVREGFPTLVLHETDPDVVHLWAPLIWACGDSGLGPAVTTSHVKALMVVTVLHELMHSVTCRLCSATTPLSSAKGTGTKSGELGYCAEMRVLGGLLGVTWGRGPWNLATAQAVTATVERGNRPQKVLVTTEACDQLLAALDSHVLPKFDDALQPWTDPSGAVCSRVNNDLSDEDIIRQMSLDPEIEAFFETHRRCTRIGG